jgi:hypothetical protein
MPDLDEESLAKQILTAATLHLALLRLIDKGLHDIALPPVTRPAIGQNDDPTEDLVRWGTTFHAYSEIAHIRTVLAGLVTLADIGNTPGGNILARHLFEWTALACYLLENLKPLYASREWKAAFELLLRTDTGNSWVKAHGHNYDTSAFPQEVAKTIRISKLIAAYKKYQTAQYGRTKVEDSYGFLSEYAHPNAACFLAYREFTGAQAYFVNPPSLSTFGGIKGFIIEWLMFVQELLGIAQEDVVRAKLIHLLAAIVEATQ